jgi:hypothetical protein
MVDLKIPFRKLAQADVATTTAGPRKFVFELFRKGAATAEETTSDFGHVSEAIGGNTSSIAAFYSEGLKRDSLVSHIFRGSGRVAVAVFVP